MLYSAMTSTMSNLASKLEDYAKNNFPVDHVGMLLKETNITYADIATYVFYSDQFYTRNLIYTGMYGTFELVLMCWKQGQKSPVHGHEGQKCWFKVLQGSIAITDYRLQANNTLQKISEVDATPGFVDGPAIIHGVAVSGFQDALSLHLYARPFAQCTTYDIISHEEKIVSLDYYSVNGKIIT